MGLFDSTKKRVVAAVVAVALVAVGGTGVYLLSQPSIQDQADAAAMQVASLLQRQARGEDVYAEGVAVLDQLESDTGCTILNINGGHMPPEPMRSAFVSRLEEQIATIIADNPGFVVGASLDGEYGAIIMLDCSEA